MKSTNEVKGLYATEQEDSLNNARAMMGWDRPFQIEDDGDLKKYRTELPNLYDDAGLDPFEFRLLAHYKRVGACTEGTRTTAGVCKMSTGQVSQKRRSLHRKGFIVMKKVTISEKEYSYKITVVDKWRENFEKYAPAATPVPVHTVNTPRSHSEIKNDEDANSLSRIANAYQSEIGLITSMIADDLQDATTTYPVKWVLDAIHEAAVQNKRGWKYCLAILKRWHAQGNQEPANKKPVAPPPAHIPDMGDLEARYGI
jgi:DnaD/phage-associated family protein